MINNTQILCYLLKIEIRHQQQESNINDKKRFYRFITHWMDSVRYYKMFDILYRSKILRNSHHECIDIYNE